MIGPDGTELDSLYEVTMRSSNVESSTDTVQKAHYGLGHLCLRLTYTQNSETTTVDRQYSLDGLLTYEKCDPYATYRYEYEDGVLVLALQDGSLLYEAKTDCHRTLFHSTPSETYEYSYEPYGISEIRHGERLTKHSYDSWSMPQSVRFTDLSEESMETISILREDDGSWECEDAGGPGTGSSLRTMVQG